MHPEDQPLAPSIVVQDVKLVPEPDNEVGQGDSNSAITDDTATTAVQDSAPAVVLPAMELTGALEDGLARIATMIAERQALDRFREAQIDRLHAELQAYKADLVEKAVRPVLMSMIRLHDDLSKLLEAFDDAAQVTLTPDKLKALLVDFQEDVELALDRNGVSAFKGDGGTFDVRRQKLLRQVPTTDASLVGQVVARLRPGFEHGQTVLERERVAVHVLANPTIAP